MVWNRWLLLGFLVTAVAGILVLGGRHLFGPDLDQVDHSDKPDQRDATAVARTALPTTTSTIEGAPDTNALSSVDRKYVWDIEHIALILDVHVFPRIARAISDSDAVALGAFLNGDC